MSGFGVRQRRCREWGALLVAGLAGLAATSQAQAGCNNARLDLVPPGYVFNINSSPQLATTVTRADNGSCDYFIGFSDGSAANYASRRLSFGSAVVPMNVYKDAARTRILKDKPSEAVVADDVLQGSFAGGPGPDAQTLNYWAAIQPQSDYLPSGIYFESLTATLYSGKVNGSYHFESSQSLVLAYYIGRRVDLSLVDTGAPFNLNDTSQDLSFGTLSSGQSRALDLVLQYNAGFRLTFSSENNGALEPLQYDSLHFAGRWPSDRAGGERCRTCRGAFGVWNQSHRGHAVSGPSDDRLDRGRGGRTLLRHDHSHRRQRRVTEVAAGPGSLIQFFMNGGHGAERTTRLPGATATGST